MINNPTTGTVKPKLKIVATEDRWDRTVHVYENGLERDAKTGHIVRPAPNTQITSENATLLLRKRRELKQATIFAAANEAVENDKIRKNYGDMAFVAAVTQAQYIKATTPDDPKSVDAARFLFQESGISVKDTVGDISAALNATASALNAQAAAALERIWRDIGQQQRGDVVDGTVSDT